LNFNQWSRFAADQWTKTRDSADRDAPALHAKLLDGRLNLRHPLTSRQLRCMDRQADDGLSN
jgi:hypothetical protein